MKKFFLTLLFIIFILIGLLGFIAIRSFNSDTFQKQIVQSITEMTGREFNVMGATYVSWFPIPKIVMNDVTLANTKEAHRNVMLRANRIGIEIEWASLIGNVSAIKKIEIENPTLFLERTDATHVNWNFPFLYSSNENLDPYGFEDTKSHMRVETLVIQNGTVEYMNNVNQGKLIISNINGNLSAQSLIGPFTFTGTFKAQDKTATAVLKIQQLVNDTQVPFSLDVTGEDDNFSLNFNGTVVPSQKQSLQIIAEGNFGIKRPNDFLNIFGFKSFSNELNVPSYGNLTYESANGDDLFKSFTIRFGESDDAVTVTGSLNREKSTKLSYNATLAINRFDYAQWKDFLSELNWHYLTNPKEADVVLKINAQNFLYKDIKAKNLHLDIAKKGTRFLINGGKVSLAGNTELNFDGGSVNQNEQTGLTVMMTAQSENLDDLLKQISLDNLSVKLPQTASVKGSVTIFPNTREFDFQELIIGKTKARGTIFYQKTETLPNIKTNLHIQNIDFDSLFNYKREGNTNILHLIEYAKEYVNGLDVIKKTNGTFDIDMSNVVFRKIPVGQLQLVGEISDNVLKINKLNAIDLANAKLDASAIISGIKSEKLLVDSLKLSFTTPQMELFMNKTNLIFPEKVTKLTDFKTDLTLNENEQVWSILSNTNAEDLSFNLNGQIDTRTEPIQYKDLYVSVSYPDFKRFSKNIIDLNGLNTSLNGEFLLKLMINGSVDKFSFSKGEVKIGSNNLLIDGSYVPGEIAELVMNIETPSFNVDNFIWNDLKGITWHGPKSKKPFSFKVYDNINHQIKIKTAQLLYQDFELKNAIMAWTVDGLNKTATLKELTGNVNSTKSEFKASGTLSWQNTPKITLDITGKNWDVPSNLLSMRNMAFGEGNMSLQAHVTGEGVSPQTMLQNLNGNGHLTFDNSVWVGTDIDRVTPLIEQALSRRIPKNVFDKEMNRLLNSGKTQINEIDGNFSIDNGVLKALNSELIGQTFTSNPMSIQWNMSEDSYQLNVPLTLTKYTDLPPFALSVSGPANALKYQPNFVDLSSSVSDIVLESNARIEKMEQQAQEEAEMIAHTERQEKIRQAIIEARKAVERATNKVQMGDNEKALYLLENAQDALEFINGLSVKEHLTDAEFIQLTEQSRLAIMKAEEAVAEAINDRFFEDRKKLHAFSKSGQQMQREIERIQNTYPDIEIVQKLSPATKKYAQLLKKLADEAHPNETDEEHQIQMKTARSAYMKVVKGYQYVLRFDTNPKTTIIQPLSLDVPQEDNVSSTKTPEQNNVSVSENVPQLPATVVSQQAQTEDSEISSVASDNTPVEPWTYSSQGKAEQRHNIRMKIIRSGENYSNTEQQNESADIYPSDLPQTGSILRGSIKRAS